MGMGSDLLSAAIPAVDGSTERVRSKSTATLELYCGGRLGDLPGGESMHLRRMQTGEVAGRTGLSVRSIRFHEGSGLVDQRVTELHDSWSAATVASHPSQQIEGLQLLPEARR